MAAKAVPAGFGSEGSDRIRRPCVSPMSLRFVPPSPSRSMTSRRLGRKFPGPGTRGEGGARAVASAGVEALLPWGRDVAAEFGSVSCFRQQGNVDEFGNALFGSCESWHGRGAWTMDFSRWQNTAISERDVHGAHVDACTVYFAREVLIMARDFPVMAAEGSASWIRQWAAMQFDTVHGQSSRRVSPAGFDGVAQRAASEFGRHDSRVNFGIPFPRVSELAAARATRQPSRGRSRGWGKVPGTSSTREFLRNHPTHMKAKRAKLPGS
ncbi:hypothetical protein OIU85_002361 [Salix viminalis]|uniref:Uncharacterized protein n=1 Tax=Salix viminalis TaxID=40686 RepID=A0A9Q0VN78_SALVM|nr:hypothetical protein OIU85_002361 [Salix viminalis]